MKFHATVEVPVSVKELAAMFCELGDEGQAQFFIEAAGLAREWPTRWGGPSYQWRLVGRHLKSCECSHDDARSMVADIAGGLDP